MATAKHVKIAEFLAARKANPKSVVIDVRDAAKYNEGHIPGAINLNKAKIESEIEKAVPEKNAEIYCHCGKFCPILKRHAFHRLTD